MLRVARKRLHPATQPRLMNSKVLGSLYIGHAAFLDQSHSLKLELPRKLPSLHDPPPVPSKHLTRCLRNRVQANPGRLRWEEGYCFASASSMIFTRAPRNRCAAASNVCLLLHREHSR